MVEVREEDDNHIGFTSLFLVPYNDIWVCNSFR